MKRKKNLFRKKLFAFCAIALFTGCNNNGNYPQQSPYRNDPIMKLTSAPREGWATDPNLSYQLYSYYPMNFYNNNLYQNMGLYGITYQ